MQLIADLHQHVLLMKMFMSQINAALYIGEAAAGHLKSLCIPFLSLGEIAVTRTVSFG